MTRSRTPVEAAAGKLIVAIQKEWGIEAGEPRSAESENVMHAAHDLLQAASKFGSIVSVIGSGSVSTFWARSGFRPIRESCRTSRPLKTPGEQRASSGQNRSLSFDR